MNALASVFRDQHRFEKALEVLVKIREIRERTPETIDIVTVLSLRTLASVHMRQGKDKEAQALLEEALEISGKQFGKDHPFTVDVRYELAKDFEAG